MSCDGDRVPPQRQEHPGTTAAMEPRPRDEMADDEGSGLLRGRVALITEADSGIGRAVAVAFAKEDADVAVAYLCEDGDAERTRSLVGNRSLIDYSATKGAINSFTPDSSRHDVT